MAGKRGLPTTKPKKLCIGQCKTEREVTRNFYVTDSPMFPDGRVPICKACIRDSIDENDIESVKRLLSQIDKPFIWDIWKSAYESPNETIGWYLREINSMPYYKGLGYGDSIEKPDEEDDITPKKSKKSKSSGKSLSSKLQNEEIDNVDTLTTESGEEIILDADLMLKWGSGYSPREYLDMEKLYRDMITSNDISTPQHKKQLTLYCKVSIEMDRAMREKDYDGFAKLSNQFDKILKSSGFRPIDRVSGADSAGVRSFAQIFEEVERDGFVEPKPIKERQDIVDKSIMYLANYWRRLLQMQELRNPPDDTPKVEE